MTKSVQEKKQRVLKQQDSVTISVSSAPSAASDILSPPKSNVSELYQTEDQAQFMDLYTDVGKRNGGAHDQKW